MAAMVLEHVGVDFPIYGTQLNLRTALFQRATGGLIQREGKNQERVVVKALVDVSMKLEEGDRLALIGHNGSGKSTLLKVMAGIYEPIAGRVLVEGRVTPLFDVMPGLDFEDNAYENIFTAGLLIGMSRGEIEAKIPQIEEFCELGEYLSLPVRTYSAGMVARLGFALSTALDPGILLMDEGIGAGDARFAERAAKRMKEFMVRSSIIVLASHNVAFVKSICNKAALMEAGRIVAIGSLDEVFDQYRDSIHGLAPPTSAVAGQSVKQESSRAKFIPAVPFGNEIAQCIGGCVETLDGVLCERPEIQLPFRVRLRFQLVSDSPYVLVPNFHFHDELGSPLMVAYPARSAPTSRGIYDVCCVVEPFVLNAGRYSVGLALSTYEPSTIVHFNAPYALRFEVVEWPGVDSRRHGWVNELPGVTRLRLDWQYSPVSEASTDSSPLGLASGTPTGVGEQAPAMLDEIYRR
jgi:ABC-type polysaccharide/polyol phosphate transport system ATPase subunit